MAKKPEDLNAVLRSIHRFTTQRDTSLSTIHIILHLWLDTKQNDCSPICGKVFVDFRGTVDEPKIFALLKLIDGFTPIFQIDIWDKVFCVSKTKEYMNKRCE